METVRKKARNPDTGQEYEVKLPAPEVVRKAILELDYPPDFTCLMNRKMLRTSGVRDILMFFAMT